MFSQFRQAVENLAQPLQSQDNPLSADGRSQSPDPLRQSSAQLAENALVNLRKSIAAQRVASPSQQNIPGRPRSASPSRSSTTRSTSDSGLRKTTLEERLRASFAGSESSPNPSTTTSPPPRTVLVNQHPTPTPVSEPANLAIGAPDVSVSSFVHSEEHGHVDDVSAPPQEPNDATQPPGVTPPSAPQPDPASSTADSTDAVRTDSTVDSVSETQEALPVANTELQQPLIQQCTQDPGVVDVSIVGADPSGEEVVKAELEPTVADRSEDAGVDVLQERLRLVEQRFAGKVAAVHLG